jgi:hypothetical protein
VAKSDRLIRRYNEAEEIHRQGPDKTIEDKAPMSEMGQSRPCWLSRNSGDVRYALTAAELQKSANRAWANNESPNKLVVYGLKGHPAQHDWRTQVVKFIEA